METIHISNGQNVRGFEAVDDAVNHLMAECHGDRVGREELARIIQEARITLEVDGLTRELTGLTAPNGRQPWMWWEDGEDDGEDDGDRWESDPDQARESIRDAESEGWW